MTVIYGIKNCDTMKKAMEWLKAGGIVFSFHDYKKDGVPRDILARAVAAHGWETVINRRGTTWRQLPEATKNSMNAETAIGAATANASLIKRPLLHHKGEIHIGFGEALYRDIFGKS